MTPRQQLLADILTTAVEGGINYWANDRAEDGTLQVYRVERDEDANVLGIYFDIEAVEDVSGATTVNSLDEVVQEHRPNEPAPRRLVYINFTSIKRALRRIAEGKVKLNATHLANIRALHFNDLDFGDYDALDADIIVQVALFGDVIYG